MPFWLWCRISSLSVATILWFHSASRPGTLSDWLHESQVKAYQHWVILVRRVTRKVPDMRSHFMLFCLQLLLQLFRSTLQHCFAVKLQKCSCGLWKVQGEGEEIMTEYRFFFFVFFFFGLNFFTVTSLCTALWCHGLLLKVKVIKSWRCVSSEDAAQSQRNNWNFSHCCLVRKKDKRMSLWTNLSSRRLSWGDIT